MSQKIELDDDVVKILNRLQEYGGADTHSEVLRAVLMDFEQEIDTDTALAEDYSTVDKPEGW